MQYLESVCVFVAISLFITGCDSDQSSTSSTDSTGGTAASMGSTGGTKGSSGPIYSCTTNQNFCECNETMVDLSDGTTTCSAASTGGFCCSEPDFVSGGGICECMFWGCKEDDLSCKCDVYTPKGKKSCESIWTRCCMDRTHNVSSCVCDNRATACDGDDVQVTNCDMAFTECMSGYSRVSTCLD
jgi:hypothetical protein